MAPISIFLLLLSTVSVVTAQQRYSNISLDSSLSPNTNLSSWLSPSGRFAFGFYPIYQDSFIIAIWFAQIPKKTIIWTANRDDPQVPNNLTLHLTSNRGLVLSSSQGDEKYITDTPESASSASMLDSGNFIIYNSDSKIIWQSFDNPTDTIVQGQRLVAGQELLSNFAKNDPRKGRFRLKMQHDGHLVQYPVQTPDTAPYSYWASGTMYAGDNTTLNLDNNGHLYMLNTNGSNIKNLSDGVFPSHNERMFYRLTIDIDGIFRLYSHSLDQNGNWSFKWNSSNNKCDPKGICGLNGYCMPMNQESLCLCPRGFDYIDDAEKTLGCKTNTSAEGCRSKDERIKYTIYTSELISWEQDSYFVSPSTTEEDCKDICLKDCNCQAAIFANSECRKQRLPLRYGRRDTGESSKVLIKAMNVVDFGNNGNFSTTSEVAKESNKVLRIDILIVSITILTIAFIVIGTTAVLIYRHRVWAYKRISEQGSVGLSEGISLRSFTYDELEKSTDGFKEELGKGSFGTVFKGSLSNSHGQDGVIAVKRLERLLDEGEREFKTEMRVIGRTHHRNLVQLLGYCHEGSNRLLVYEYMSNGSLANFLFNHEKCPTWDERVRIALNIARGILYLHEECEIQIIHCDIKPQNILMDEYHCAKIADFGLAKLLKPDQTRTYTGIRGTRGYVAPEWHRNMAITIKADVYSFGIVLLEIICCRRHLEMEMIEEEVVLVNWVYECFENREVGKLVKDEEVDKARLERMVRVALWCIQDEPSLRPSMKKVILMLEGTIEIPVPPGPTSFLSSI